jgi:hypothetical protein
MTDDDDDADKRKIRRNGRCITKRRRSNVILGVVGNKAVCLVCSKVMSAPHETPCSTTVKLYVKINSLFLRGS